MKISRVLIPAIQASLIILFAYSTHPKDIYWYNYLFAYLFWMGVFGLIYECTPGKEASK